MLKIIKYLTCGIKDDFVISKERNYIREIILKKLSFILKKGYFFFNYINMLLGIQISNSNNISQTVQF